MSAVINKLILLSNHTIQARALGLCIAPKLRVDLTIVDTNSQPFKLNYNKDTLILVDLSKLDNETKLVLQKKLNKRPSSIALVNTKEHITLDEIANWPNICGYINFDDNFDVICKGIKAMMAGETWFSPHIISQLIDYYRKHHDEDEDSNSEQKSDISLTYREKEILAALTKTASNREIAHQLFISETTIKSHLYNIFRKLNVQNRQQAISWANSNLH